VSFLSEQSQAIILDLDDQVGFWGINRILPDGKKENIKAPISHSIDKSKNKKEAKAEYRKMPDLKAHTIGMTHSYKRSLNISDLCDFSQAGTYRVQLIYSSGWVADHTNDTWSGSFCGSVFIITINK
jgi:hypothetical protein